MFIDQGAVYEYERLSSYGHEPALWPSAIEWNAILRGASWQAGMDSRHTLLCHLTQKVASGKHVSSAVAHRFVVTRICVHVEQLFNEFALGGHAGVVAEQVQRWLSSISAANLSYVVDPYWPTPAEWLAIDRGAATHAYLNGRLTLSSNFARVVAQHMRVRTDVAKQWVHERIAIHAQQLARELGYGIFASAIVRSRILRWLNSFDRT